MRKPIPSWRMIVVGIVMLALAGFLYSQSRSVDTAHEDQPGKTAVDQPESQSRDKSERRLPITTTGSDLLATPALLQPATPMPEASLPLAEQLDALEQLAQVGDPEAACRLFVGTRRCRMVSQRLQRAEQLQQSLERGQTLRIGEDIAVLSIANALEQTRSLANWCEGADPARFPDVDVLAERAFTTMTTTQKVVLVLSRQDGSIARIPRQFSSSHSLGGNTGFMYPQFLSDHGLAILEEGVHQANPLALEGLIMLYSPAWIPGSEEAPRLSMPNRRQFVRYGLLMTRVFGEDEIGPIVGSVLARSLASLNPKERAEAERQAEIEAAQWRAQAASSTTSSVNESSNGHELEKGCMDLP